MDGAGTAQGPAGAEGDWSMGLAKVACVRMARSMSTHYRTLVCPWCKEPRGNAAPGPLAASQVANVIVPYAKVSKLHVYNTTWQTTVHRCSSRSGWSAAVQAACLGLAGVTSSAKPPNKQRAQQHPRETPHPVYLTGNPGSLFQLSTPAARQHRHQRPRSPTCHLSASPCHTLSPNSACLHLSPAPHSQLTSNPFPQSPGPIHAMPGRARHPPCTESYLRRDSSPRLPVRSARTHGEGVSVVGGYQWMMVGHQLVDGFHFPCFRTPSPCS